MKDEAAAKRVANEAQLNLARQNTSLSKQSTRSQNPVPVVQKHSRKAELKNILKTL